MFLDVTCVFYILLNTAVYWVNNSATLGGAINAAQISPMSFSNQISAEKGKSF